VEVKLSDRSCSLMSRVAEILSASLEALFFVELVIEMADQRLEPGRVVVWR
jgi:hypothetical protein